MNLTIRPTTWPTTNPTTFLGVLSPMVAVEDRYMAGSIAITLYHLYPPMVRKWLESAPRVWVVSELSFISSIYR